MAKVARGEVRRLLLVINELQGMVGQALGDYMNDRSQERAKKVITTLTNAHSLCIEATSKYDPVDNQ